jgi:uncharacterized coiled-coil protein SlyX
VTLDPIRDAILGDGGGLEAAIKAAFPDIPDREGDRIAEHIAHRVREYLLSDEAIRSGTPGGRKRELCSMPSYPPAGAQPTRRAPMSDEIARLTEQEARLGFREKAIANLCDRIANLRTDNAVLREQLAQVANVPRQIYSLGVK